MRRGAVIAGSGVALLVLGLSGCAGLTASWRDPSGPRNPATSPQALALSQEAQEAIDRHDDDRALALLLRLVVLTPRSPEVHYRLGQVFQAKGRLPEAEASYRRALGFDKEYVAAMIGLGSIDLAAGRSAEALIRFDAAIELDPHHAEAHLERARALESLGRSDEALSAYFRTLEFNPNSRQARLRVATLQLAQGQPEQAHARLDTLVEQNPDDAEALHQRGRAHMAMNHLPQAASDLKAAAARMPDRPDVFYQLALALEAAHQPAAALAAAEHALKLAPGFNEARTLTEKLRR